MYLKRLELLGFKSFAAKTVLELDRGVTGVVGPNGSGKSNVVDAVRWALGEQSLRAVRSRKSEEVIFAGNSRRAGTGMAEVSLVLDNSDGSLPLAFEEVAITRRIYRSGEGEYLINRTRARLRDVLQLLSHASLGPNAYAVVGQGAVDEVLLQRPEERRALVETAADISKYQLKLRESLDKLTETLSNVQRADDIRSEIAPRLGKLRLQASRALKHEETRAKLREALQKRYLLEIRQARERNARDVEVERASAAAFQEAARRHEAAQRLWNGLRDEVRSEESALEAARERSSTLRAARARAEREVALSQERQAAYRRQMVEAEEDLAAGRKELAELRDQMAALGRSRAELAEREAEARANLEAAETEWRRVASDQRVLQGQLERAMREHQVERSRRSDLENRRASLQRDLRKAQDARKESARAAEEASARLGSLEEQLSIAEREREGLRSRLAEIESGRREAEGRLAAVDSRLEEARRDERSAWERESDLRTRLTMLRSLKEEHRGVPSGAKALLEAGIPGMRGMLASMLRVPDEYLVAVSAALGGAQSYLVSERFSDGLEALGFLAEGRGAATIAPMQMERRPLAAKRVEEFRARLNGLLEAPACRGLALDLVSCPPGTEELCVRYLGLSVVVEGLPEAVELYRRLLEQTDGAVPFQVVTLDGRVLRARGEMVSTQSGERNGSLLAREAELLALTGEWERARESLSAARERVTALEGSRQGLARAVQEAASAAAQLQPPTGKRGSEITDLSSQIARVEASMEWHRSRLSSLERDESQGREALSKVETELAEGESRGASARARIEELQGDVAEEQARVSDVAARRSGLQSELSGAQGGLRELGARMASVSESLQRAEGRVKRQEGRTSELGAAMTQAAGGPRATFSATEQDELETAETVVRESGARIADLKARGVVAEREQAGRGAELETARDALAAARARAHESSVEMAALAREASRELELDGGESGLVVEEVAARLEAEATETSPEEPADDLPAAMQRVETLRRQIASLGTINAEAPEEYRQLSERHDFLAEQLEDLRRAERTLRGVIEELRQTMEERFQATFQRVNEEFGRYFSTLFGGGSARLALTRPDDPLEGGVEVVATPPGRKTSGLLGLSGGERALTAISLLFAMMKVNPSPFCVLDEVDAALDESNVRRFCKVLQELAANTQFLVITHNRTTMEMAGALYGVSMPAESVSAVMSVRLAMKESQS